MTFEDYQSQTHYTNLYPDDTMLFCLALGINSEAGEVADKIKKYYRGDTTDRGYAGLKILLMGEIGDIMWYISELAIHLGVTLDEIAEMNIDKLKDRAKRGVINGSGDNR
jgi:NTP pyrophosphatase (non-canonical NTP hydrolase)